MGPARSVAGSAHDSPAWLKERARMKVRAVPADINDNSKLIFFILAARLRVAPAGCGAKGQGRCECQVSHREKNAPLDWFVVSDSNKRYRIQERPGRSGAVGPFSLAAASRRIWGSGSNRAGIYSNDFCRDLSPLFSV